MDNNKNKKKSKGYYLQSRVERRKEKRGERNVSARCVSLKKKAALRQFPGVFR